MRLTGAGVAFLQAAESSIELELAPGEESALLSSLRDKKIRVRRVWRSALHDSPPPRTARSDEMDCVVTMGMQRDWRVSANDFSSLLVSRRRHRYYRILSQPVGDRTASASSSGCAPFWGWVSSSLLPIMYFINSK